MSKIFFADWTTPSARERKQLEARLPRVELIGKQVAKATASLADVRRDKELIVRWPFVARATDAIPGEWSDRSLPPRPERPPATRITSAHGIALRFYLTALHVAQTRSPQEKPNNTMPLSDRDADVSWVDLVATPTTRGVGANSSVSVRDKNIFRVQQALRTLGGPGVQLVHLPNKHKKVGTYEGFLLLHERGAPYTAGGEPNERYTVPGDRTSELVRLPAGLFDNGWIHVLEDTELTVLLMIASLHAKFGLDRQVYLDGESRLVQYGIGRDAYLAHHMLERLGLIDVEADADRHGLGSSLVSGFAKGVKPKPHRFRLLPEGFTEPAVDTITAAIKRRLGDSSGFAGKP